MTMVELTNQLSQPGARHQLGEEAPPSLQAEGTRMERKEDKHGLIGNMVIESLPPMREEGPRVFIISWEKEVCLVFVQKIQNRVNHNPPKSRFWACLRPTPLLKSYFNTLNESQMSSKLRWYKTLTDLNGKLQVRRSGLILIRYLLPTRTHQWLG